MWPVEDSFGLYNDPQTSESVVWSEDNLLAVPCGQAAVILNPSDFLGETVIEHTAGVTSFDANLCHSPMQRGQKISRGGFRNQEDTGALTQLDYSSLHLFQGQLIMKTGCCDRSSGNVRST